MKIVSFGNYDIFAKAEDGRALVKAFIVSDTLPEGFPESDAAVRAAFPEYAFDTLSIMQVLDPKAETHVYIVREDGTWQGTEGTVSYHI